MARSDWLPPTQHEPSNRLIVVAALGSCWRAIRRRGGDWFGEGAEGGGLFNPLACQPASQLLACALGGRLLQPPSDVRAEASVPVARSSIPDHLGMDAIQACVSHAAGSSLRSRSWRLPLLVLLGHGGLAAAGPVAMRSTLGRAGCSGGSMPSVGLLFAGREQPLGDRPGSARPTEPSWATSPIPARPTSQSSPTRSRR